MTDSDLGATGRVSRLSLLSLLFMVLAACSDNGPSVPVVLTDLQVRSVSATLSPAFDPGIYRYSIIADNQGSPLTITPSADPSISITIDGSLTSSGTAHTAANLVAGDSVVIEVRSNDPSRTDSVRYEILYLPSDFSALSVTVREIGVSSQPLYVNLNGPDSNFIAVLDNNAVPLFYRREEQVALDFKWHAATGERSYARLTGDVRRKRRRLFRRTGVSAAACQW